MIRSPLNKEWKVYFSLNFLAFSIYIQIVSQTDSNIGTWVEKNVSTSLVKTGALTYHQHQQHRSVYCVFPPLPNQFESTPPSFSTPHHLSRFFLPPPPPHKEKKSRSDWKVWGGVGWVGSKWVLCLTQRSCFWVALVELSWVELRWVLTINKS